MQYYKACLTCAAFVTLTQIAILYFGMDLVLDIFTQIDSIRALLRSCWPIYMVFIFFNTIQLMGQTVMKYTLNLDLGLILNVLAYFVVGIPLAWFFAFRKDMGIPGIWTALIIACVLLTLSYNYVISRIDWDALITIIEERTRNEQTMK